MRKILFCALIFGFIGTPTFSQTVSKLKKGDRPVFYSARQLADDCKQLRSINGGKPLSEEGTTSVTTDQLTGAAECTGYINGVHDQELEVMGSHYHPVPTRLQGDTTLIDTFIKYVADHPEEQDLAASTILAKALKIVANAETPR